ncbi:tetrahydrofolate dehydrogenase/cyclohydrolase [Tribonema minus]|uniref:Tetrahydrofolate dehydrogenase/cyclohydrolase n=1 Tax=Tribonema minus TaxID=303371 RepID=A0A836CNW7_9STRA|nr:tetrahydrofolate dehydrogenase/cyclohydrolase [Tribonema minus]
MATEAEVIDGKAVAAAVRQELKEQVAQLKARYEVTPGLAVVLVGARKDSATYVRMKRKACEEIGVASFGCDLPEDTTQEELITRIREFNARRDVHGVLVQLPVPKHIDERAVLDAIDPQKDVDGLHPLNVAALSMGRAAQGAKRLAWAFDELDFHVPPTPQGCVELLDRSGVQIAGKRAVVLGRSNLVGIPTAMLLMKRDATVTIVHSRSTDVEEAVRAADIVVAAVGKAELVKGDWIKPGAVVIDVGINSVDDATKKAGYRMVGDVDFAAAKQRASKITPVPGGVGPMTVAMLMRNTVSGAARAAAAAGGSGGGAASAAAAASANGTAGAKRPAGDMDVGSASKVPSV